MSVSKGQHRDETPQSLSYSNCSSNPFGAFIAPHPNPNNDLYTSTCSSNKYSGIPGGEGREADQAHSLIGLLVLGVKASGLDSCNSDSEGRLVRSEIGGFDSHTRSRLAWRTKVCACF